MNIRAAKTISGDLEPIAIGFQTGTHQALRKARIGRWIVWRVAGGTQHVARIGLADEGQPTLAEGA